MSALGATNKNDSGLLNLTPKHNARIFTISSNDILDQASEFAPEDFSQGPFLSVEFDSIVTRTGSKQAVSIMQ